VAAKPAAAAENASLTDILARAAAINLARLATLGLHPDLGGWTIA